MMLIHFPSALLPMDFVCYALQYYTHQTSFVFASFYALVGAVVIGLIAVFTGVLDISRIPPEKTGALNKAFAHGGINTFIIIVYTALAISLIEEYPSLPDATLTLLVTKGALISFMMVGNYLGGSLILKDKIGIEE